MAPAKVREERRVNGLCAALAATILAVAVTAMTAPHMSHAQSLSRAAVRTTPNGLFNSNEIQRDGVHLLRKWHTVMQRVAKDRRARMVCSPKNRAACHVLRWKAFLARMRHAKPLAQLRAVNRYINRWRYVNDRVNYGKLDYWATPTQMFRHGGGDCEDYAIAKYLSLKAMGWPVSKLRIVVLQDLNLGIAHAVLAVKVNGTFYILDNQIRVVIDHRQIRHYRPIYSMNEHTWWYHRTPRSLAGRS